MSNDETKSSLEAELTNEKVTDLSIEQMARVQAYIDSGTPGISAINDAHVFRMMSLYLDGKTYSQIARANNVKIEIVLYLAHKTNWFQHKQLRLIELNNNLQERLLETKLASQNFINDLMAFMHKRLGKKIEKYNTTGDDADGDKVGLAEIDKYLKTAEILAKLADGKGNHTPANLNLGEGATHSTQEKPVDATASKTKTIGNVLKDLANLRREEENNKSSAKADSNKET